MAMLEKKGFGQVEPNHLSAQATGQIYAQIPVDEEIEALENGCFLRRDNSKGELNTEGSTEWMLVYNEVKLYDNARQGFKDFRVTADETLGRRIYPRVFKINVGDIFTTNLIEGDSFEPGDKLAIKEGEGDYEGVGILAAGEDEEMQFEVMKMTTMPDGQPAVKVTRVA